MLGSDNKQNACNAIRSMTTQALPLLNVKMLKGKTTASFFSHLVLIFQFWWSITIDMVDAIVLQRITGNGEYCPGSRYAACCREDWAQPPSVYQNSNLPYLLHSGLCQMQHLPCCSQLVHYRDHHHSRDSAICITLGPRNLETPSSDSHTTRVWTTK